jgi:hypothetical protein
MPVCWQLLLLLHSTVVSRAQPLLQMAQLHMQTASWSRRGLCARSYSYLQPLYTHLVVLVVAARQAWQRGKGRSSGKAAARVNSCSYQQHCRLELCA